MKIVSIVLAYVALAAGVTAALTMFFRMGRPGDKPRPALLWVHRVAGYCFVALMTFLFAAMLYKITIYGKGLTAGVAWHGAAGLAVMAFIFTKWAVVRPFRGLLKLAPALGIVVLALAFVVVNLGATMDLLDWLAVRREAGAAAEAAATGEEEVAEAEAPTREGVDALHDARFVFAEKCGRCHHLRRTFEAPRPAEQWTPLIERMQSYDAGRISDDDVVQIEFYVTSDYGPGR
jgi:mono/diheme cytochrome c family protein